MPAVYLAEVEPETGWFTLLMEDIAGAAQGDQIAACRADTAAAVLDEMAGCTHRAGRCRDWNDWNGSTGPPRVRRLSRRLAALAPARLLGALRRHAHPGAPAGVPPLRRGPAGVPASAGRTPHREPRRLSSRPLLFQPDDPRPVVVDWQTAAWAGASVDVAYFIGGCLNTEDRRVHEQDLLVHYHDALVRRGVRGYPLERLRADTRRDTFAGILMAIVASMVVQRTERGDLMFLTSATRHVVAPPMRTPPPCSSPRNVPSSWCCARQRGRSVMAGFMLDALATGALASRCTVRDGGDAHHRWSADGPAHADGADGASRELEGATSAGTEAARCMASTSCTPNWWW